MKKLLLLLLFPCAMMAQAGPTAWVESDYQVAPPGTRPTITVKLDADGVSTAADWFGGFYNPAAGAGLYHYIAPQGLTKASDTLDITALRTAYQGPMRNFTRTGTFLPFPPGRNILFFGIDTTMDGQVTPGYVVATANFDVGNDCHIVSVQKIADYGYTGLFRMRFGHSMLGIQEQYFVHGQQFPDGPWIKYPYGGQTSTFDLVWPNGQPFEFTYGGTSGGKDNYIDSACSLYRYPVSAAPGGAQHLRLVLGTKKVCAANNTGDSLITGVYNLGGTLRRVYVDFAKLPIRNYQKIMVNGQSAPDSAWKDYSVTDQFPCFYTDVNWPSIGSGFEFSFYVVKEDGATQWADPTPSKYLYNGHFRIPAGDFAQAPYR
ncbi:MAG: hypothetical protein AAB547_03310 [Patescibacteria group bacterium]